MKPFETYIQDLVDIHSTGAAVKETSYYGALEKLINKLGETLKPKVRCVMQLKNQGAGMPDGGLFTARQFRRKSADQPADPQNPERGVIEVKGTGDDAWVVARTNQISKYWDKYRQVLVTNYRDFVLIGQDANGKPVNLETYRLADSEAVFWTKAANPRQFAEEQEEQFTEYLKRVMLQAATIASPKDVAWFLASYAKDARARIEKSALPALTQVRQALEEALGVAFENEQGDRFFKSTLIQTLFYGIFSAWVLWHKQGGQGHFNWRTAAWHLHVPMIKALFEKVATPTHLGKLDLVEVLDWTGDALNRVDRTSFFSQFDEGQAVQYFYEPFLEAFDPQLRKELGVWYTPPEIVQYMVARVDTVLREELNIEDGLADPNVYIFDPCCGTGAYLVEVLKHIDTTLKAKGLGGLVGAHLKSAAMNRVFGFEILTAPFVVAHLQLGLLLQNLGVPLSNEQERVGVYLTNALTGWEPPDEEGKQRVQQLAFSFPELKQEHDAADQVKQDKPILVVLGNPPYNAYAGVSPEEEQGLVEPYKEGLISKWGIKKFNLDDLYIRFFRVAERCIAEKSPKKGIVCYISNHSWIGEPSFVVLRQNLLRNFDNFWIENMHGNRKTSEYAPDGRTSETIFAIPGFSAGIQQGVAISLWVNNGKDEEKEEQNSQVLFRDDVHAAKAAERRAQLLRTLEEKDIDSHYELAKPAKNNRFSFRPAEVSEGYLEWPKVVDLCEEPPINGLFEKRGGALIDIDKDALAEQMRKYYDLDIHWDIIKKSDTRLTKDAARFNAEKARIKILNSEVYDSDRLCRYALRPFDTRWCYYSGVRPLWNEPRPTLYAQLWQGNSFLMSRPSGIAKPEGIPLFCTQVLGDNDFLRGHAYYFPIQLRSVIIDTSKPARQMEIEGITDIEEVKITANLSEDVRIYLAQLGITEPDTDVETAGLIWMHALAIGYSPAYLEENADGIRNNWPRIPLPDNREMLMASAELGRQVAALLDTENPVSGVTSGRIRSALQAIAVVSRMGDGNLDPNNDFSLTAGWGHAGKNGITMPGKGRIVERNYSSEEQNLIDNAIQQLGKGTCDIYLNDVAYWKNIPARVWDYAIGGYQVIKKWLSYREQVLLERPLKMEEVSEVTNMARRIAAILLLEPDLNANYEVVKESPYKWPTSVEN